MFIYQRTLRHIFNEPELKYVKDLSFDSIVSPRFRYLIQLRQKHSIHIQWLDNFVKVLEEKNKISASAYFEYEKKLSSWLSLNIVLPGIQHQYEEKATRYKLE